MTPLDDADHPTRDFEARRARLRAIAYRMLGSINDADDAVQEAWLRFDRADKGDVTNIDGWLTTVVSRVCLNLIRSREARREDPLPDSHVPDPVLARESGSDPEQEAMLADTVGLAMQVVLDSLAPDERLAFVLHDMFTVPFDDIAELVDRSPAAARQLASRARRRVAATAPPPDPDPARQRVAVDAYLAAARDGDLDALVAVLHPDVVLRADGGRARASLSTILRGSRTVAGQAALSRRIVPFARPVLVNGAAGIVAVAGRGSILSVMGFTVVDGRITAIDVLMDPDRLATLDIDRVLDDA